MPLHPIIPQSLFEKWGLDYVGLIKPTTEEAKLDISYSQRAI